MAGLLFLVIITMMLGIYFLAGLPALTARDIQGGKKTASMLGQARDALMGRAIQDVGRPGSFACPDIMTNISNNVPNDGIADLLSGNDCPAYAGRLPWRTLDLPDLRDASGERLWYVLSRNFRDDDSAQPINSDTKGTLTVYAQDGVTSLTPPGSEAVAVVFAPGVALGSQVRDANAASCVSLGRSIAHNLCPDNYLDAANGRNNASSAGPYIAGAQTAAFNDAILVIRARDFMPTVEKLVAKQLRNWLQTYYTTNGYYPYPARYDHCDDENCRGDASTCRGRIPSSAASGNAPWLPPSWFVNNQWYREIYYSVGAGYLQSPSGVSCGAGLAVSGASVGAVFFMPGTPVGSIVRPSNRLADYLEDAENQDGWGVGANDAYVVPTSSLNDRDRVYTLP